MLAAWEWAYAALRLCARTYRPKGPVLPLGAGLGSNAWVSAPHAAGEEKLLHREIALDAAHMETLGLNLSDLALTLLAGWVCMSKAVPSSVPVPELC